MDETGVPLDPKPPKVFCQKGQKKVRYSSSGNKSQITVLGCANATGQAMPPFIIFDAKQLNILWTKGEVPGTRYGLSKNGWTDQELFKGWLKDHFLIHAVSGRPLLLLVDGHSYHYEPESIRFAKDNSIVIFCLPPHTTHEAQPLDVSLFGPLKQHWREVCHQFLQSSCGKVVSKLNFSQLFSQAWSKPITAGNICSGFQKAGIVSFNPDALNLTKSSTATSSTRGDVEYDDQDTSIPTHDFTPDEEELFARRFEEGYDLFDRRYEEWLKVNHPQVSTVQPAQMAFPIPSQAHSSSLAATSFSHTESTPTPLSSMFPVLHSSPTAPPNTPCPTPSTPNTLSPTAQSNTPPSTSPVLRPSPTALPKTPSSTSPVLHPSPTAPSQSPPIFTTPSTHHSSTSPKSLLGRHLKPLESMRSTITKKTGHARVLTSDECLGMLEEKKRKKQFEAEEKEKRKLERERKREEKAKEVQRKKEMQARKKLEKSQEPKYWKKDKYTLLCSVHIICSSHVTLLCSVHIVCSVHIICSSHVTQYSCV